MAKWRVAQIVRETYGLAYIFVKAERARDGPRYLRHLYCVGKPRPVVVAFVKDKDLGLVLKPPKGVRVYDPVAVALEGASERVFRLIVKSGAPSSRFL